MSDYPIWPSTLPPCPVASGIIRRLAESGPEYVERMWTMGDKPRWIPVSERLPKCSGDGDMENVLGYYPDFPPAILLVWYTGYRWEDGDGSGKTLKAPTHWMPLPEPPSA